MKIDIDKLTEAELVDLNHRIVERLRFLNQARAHIQMLEFKIGDRVQVPRSGTGALCRRAASWTGLATVRCCRQVGWLMIPMPAGRNPARIPLASG